MRSSGPTWMRCRDTEQARRKFAVSPLVDERGAQVTLTVDDDTPPLVLDPLQVGQLRGVLREAVFRAAAIAEAKKANR